MKRNKLLVAGGGTGGHFFSGLAFGELFLEKYPEAHVHFVGVRRGIEGRYRFSDPRMKISFVQALGFKNVSFFKKLEAIFLLFYGVTEAFGILFRERPRVVMGVGGYASAPILIASLFLKLILRFRVVVIDQNSVPGIVNKFFSKFFDAYSGFPYPGFKTIDLPTRKAVRELKEQLSPVQWPPRKILVMGGSQGAAGLNRAWINLLPELKEQFPDIEIQHQTGQSSESNVKAAYENLGMKAETFAFHPEIEGFIAEADLVVCRAGALSLFEIMALERPAILVPFPEASDDHQFKNAKAVQSTDWIIFEQNLDWERLSGLLRLKSPSILRRRGRVEASWNAVLHS